MSLEMVGSLVALALVDSSSFGTLLIPILLVLANRRVAWRPMVIYLGTVLFVYFLLGVALMLGLAAAISALDGVFESTAFKYLQLALGTALLVGSFFVDRGSRGRNRRSRLEGVTESLRAMVLLALSATAVEAASMLPYVAAISILSTADLSVIASLPILFGYCLVMILPALLVLALAGTLGDRVWGRLERFGNWMERSTAGALGWIVGIAGFFIASDASSRLFLDDDATAAAMLTALTINAVMT